MAAAARRFFNHGARPAAGRWASLLPMLASQNSACL